MAFVKKVSAVHAQGVLKRVFAPRTKAGARLWEIVAVQSQTPEVLRESLRFYTTLMFGEGELTRAQREMIAVVTSTVNECHY